MTIAFANLDETSNDPPKATFAINGGDTMTASRSVKLTLTVSDATGVAYRVKNENAASFPDTWTALTKTPFELDWDLSPGPGWKTVSVELRFPPAKNGPPRPTITVSDEIEYIVSQPGEGLWLNFRTPDYDKQDNKHGNKQGNKESYFRIGAAKADGEKALVDKAGVTGGAKLSSNETIERKALLDGNTRPGWFEYTDGDRTEITRGQKADIVNGDRFDSTEKDALSYVKGTLTSITGNQKNVATCTHAFTWGDNISLYGGMKLFATVGSVVTSTLGATVAANATVDLACNMSHKIDVSLGTKFSWGVDEMKHITRSGTKAKRSIVLRVKSTPDPHAFNKKAVALGIGAGVGSVAAAGSTTALISLGELKPDDLTGAAVALGVGGAASIAALVASLMILKSEKMKSLLEKVRYKYTFSENGAPAVDLRSGKDADAEISLKKEGVLLSQNNAAGESEAMIALGDKAGEVVIVNKKGAAVLLRADGNAHVTAKDTSFVAGDESAYLSAGSGLTNAVGVTSTGAITFDGKKAEFFKGVLTVMA